MTKAVAGSRGAAHALRDRPERIVLDPRPDLPPSDKPTVHIFLGTEPAQYRAERIFLWSIEQVRDPSRRYEIHLMKELTGFDPSGWTTGFTNYRFAVPHYTGGQGRAIYNDTDQIYLADPGELFDTDLSGHGFLAVSPKDSSVALIDCARMAEVWNLDAAQNETKKELLSRATARAGVYGECEPGWNTRDHDEYDPERAKVYHFTTLATQPFRPFPERFVYQAHENGELWYSLERSADAEGYHPFTRENPSLRFRRIVESGAGLRQTARADAFAEQIRELCETSQAGSVASNCSGLGANGRDVRTFDLRDLASGELGSADALVCLGGLDELPDEDLPWVLDSLFQSARLFVFVAVACRATRAPGPMPPHGNVRDHDWWRWQFEGASRRRPDVHWELRTADGSVLAAANTRSAFGGRLLGDQPPRVWVLTDDRPGNTTQSTGLAEELGWPYERKELEFGAFSALHNELVGASLSGLTAASASQICEPWPDLVIAAGGRTAPVARWIRGHSQGRTRAVQLGRKGSNPARHFDLSVSPAHARLFPHPRRMETSLPLTRVNRESLAAAREQWSEIFEAAREPRVAVLVGGETARHYFGEEDARRMGEAVAEMARKAGASLFVTTSRRTPAPAVAALEEALPHATYFHKWSADSDDRNPYLGYLALADALVVTDDSESMLAEACATQKPVSIYPMPMREPNWLERVKESAVARAIERPLGERGTPKPQAGIELFLARLVENGLLRPARDLASMRERLARLGQARIFDGELVMDREPLRSEMERVADRVRELMGRG